MSYNEADTRANLIDPRLEAAGWGRDQIAREHYYRRDLEYTDGRVILRGTRSRRNEGRKVDYLLRYAGFPIAVVEAKAEGESAESGFEQGKGYARDMGVPFAYATNGRDILEYDYFTRQSRELAVFPTPDRLWGRWLTNTGMSDVSDKSQVAEARQLYDPQAAEARRRNPLLHPYCPSTITGKTPRYFQETAVARVLERVMRGQKRILLTMATGTGKTFTAFQIVWKLLKSRWLYRRHPDRPARVLFLADRVILRDQAYNAFAPFANEASDPRFRIAGRPVKTHFDLYFGIYQTLWSEDDEEQRLYKVFASDFFDLIIIDEAHRSGFGTWREILDYFGSAIHLGMTATPKRSDNVDTYAYFCQQESEVLVDPDDPGQGTRQAAAFEYSLGQGIEDGFLATYKVHRVRTTVDKDGLHLQDALRSGAEVLVPDEVEARELYTTPQFEREITLPDRTQAMVAHLAGLLRRFGPMQKTMVFCVDTAHAQLAARYFNDAFAHLGYDDYAVPIVAEEGEDAKRALRRFQDSDQKTPVVATTAELLSTGVDVPACRNVVFMKTVASTVLFKQILGRGSRIDPETGKEWFRIIDYTHATRLFDEWDRPPLPPDARKLGPETATLSGKVVAAETGDLLVGASVAVLLGPNVQRGPAYTDDDGQYRFAQLPAGVMTLVASGPGYRQRQMQVELPKEAVTTLDVELKAAGEPAGKIKVSGLEVTIADEAIFLIESTGQSLSLQEYENYTRRQVRDLAGAQGVDGLREAWVHPERRHRFLERLLQASVHPEVLAEVKGLSDADLFDVLAHLAFDAPLRTRDERARAFRNREQRFLQRYSPPAREVLQALLEKYQVGGVDEIANAQVFRLPPFDGMGQVMGVTQRFGDVERLRETLGEVQRRLYAS
jgi:type I restriction enzyme, R subunit